MTVTLVFPETLAQEIAHQARSLVECASVILARLVKRGNETRLMARSIHPVPANAYIEQSAWHLLIEPQGYVPALGLAEVDGSIPIWFHTHPGQHAVPLPSAHDHQVDRDIADLFQLRSGTGYYGTLIASPRGESFAFSGTVQHETNGIQSIDRVWSVGDRWHLIHSFSENGSTRHEMFSRNVKAFGPDIQHILGDLRIAVIGSGGTGSAVAEQLVRLGVRKLLLVDPDTLSLSNVTRVYGSTPTDVGRPKVEVARNHLLSIAADLDCEIIQGMLTDKTVAQRVSKADLIFGCTDDNAGRIVLSRLSTYFLTPVIDMGVLLSSGDAGVLKGIHGRVTTMAPGSACLICRNRIDLARAAAELRTPEERKKLVDEGYAPALGQTEPAVVAFTTAVAALAVNELLDRLIGYGPPDHPNELLVRLHDREISNNRADPRAGHFCDQHQVKWAAGDEQPFLGQLWPKD